MSVQRFNKGLSEVQPYHIYYDMNIINNDSSFPAQPVRFQYKETRSNYYLLSPQDYFMSIVRFNLDTPTLPVFIPQINLNTNTNFGGIYPIQSMNGTSTTLPFLVNFYTTISIPVGSVLYLSLTNPSGSTAHEPSGAAGNYYRVLTSGLSASSQQVTSCQLSNPLAVGGGNPGNYAGGTQATVWSQNGGTIQAGFAVLPVANLVYAGGTLTLTFTAQSNLSDLTQVFAVGDIINVTNALQYNGAYKILTIGATSMTLNAPNLATIALLSPYAGGGTFTSAGDFYNITPYNVTLQYKTGNVQYSYTQQITFTPNDLTTVPPQWNPQNAQALSLADVTSNYYWVYNYEVFVNMVNQALTNCFWGLSGALYGNTGTYLPMSGSTQATYQPPSMSWNQSNLTAIITADNKAFQQSVGNFISLYFNQPLSTLFDSFPYQYPNVLPSSNLYSYIVFNTNAGAGLYIVSSYSPTGVITPNYTAIQVYQDHQTASLMNPVQSIVFTSILLPVVMENVGTPLILNGTSPNQITLGSTANIFPIVTDFVIPFSATNGYVPDITYTPSGDYRLVDLYGTSPANQVDISIYWKDQYGLLHPFLLGSGCSGSLKLMFRRKDFYNVSLEE